MVVVTSREPTLLDQVLQLRHAPQVGPHIFVYLLVWDENVNFVLHAARGTAGGTRHHQFVK